ncbi:ATPase domain-containing protein [Halorientalis brevis]|uniref:non-specific serine/threonine protein kinase n=1 Tax=Halorientalis brevis TaxID=1126241 RepID=A0ABD6C880_9EURY|nr:ATPase domain-containing protein [Halorientalis brevis]
MIDNSLDRVSSGVPGLDGVLRGGFVKGRNYLVRGAPGTGKSILGFHFLTAGGDDETSLLINLEESSDDVRKNAATLGFDLGDVEMLDLSPESDFFVADQSYEMFSPSEVEQRPVTEEIIDRVDDVQPDRVFVDPLTQLRYLAPDEYQFRKQVLAFMRYLKERGATVLYTTQQTPSSSDVDLQFLSDGILELDNDDGRRTISVPKFRGSDRQKGTHSLRVDGDGLEVFPELVPEAHSQEFESEQISSGVPGLDTLLGGGIERGTVTVISGPTGVGKTTTGSLFAEQTATRDERSVIYLFEESESTFTHRTESIGISINEMTESASLAIEEVEPLTQSPEAFAKMVREEVEQRDTEVVMIDGVKGYTLSIQGEETALRRKLHALCRYLKNMGVTVILVDEIDEITGDFQVTNAGISYLADNILFLQYLEVQGELRKTTGVLKKRVSSFEHTLREFEITDDGVHVGDPITGHRGILQGTPEPTEDD